MKKKLLALVLCLLMLSATMVSVQAYTLDYAGVKDAIKLVGDKLQETDKADGISAWNALRSYLETDLGIETLINCMEDPSTIPTDLELAFDRMGDVDEYKDVGILGLSIAKAIPASDRKVALAAFPNEEVTGFSNDELKAAKSLYERFVGTTGSQNLKAKYNFDENALLALFSCMKGSFVLTDDEVTTSELALKTIDSDFAVRLYESVSEYNPKINGVSYSNGKTLMNLLIACLNDTAPKSVISEVKLIFSGYDMYEPLEISDIVVIRPSTGGGSSSNSGSSISFGNTDAGTAGETTGETTTITTPEVIDTPILTTGGTDLVSSQKDMGNHWSRNYVGALMEKQILVGYEDNTFRPDDNLTRQELAVALVRALGLEAEAANRTATVYSDSASIASWATGAVAVLTERGTFRGYGDDNSFRPNAEISREELAAVMARELTITTNILTANFADRSNIATWAVIEVDKAYTKGIVIGYEDNTFRPKNSITRGEASVLLYNLMEVLK